MQARILFLSVLREPIREAPNKKYSNGVNRGRVKFLKMTLHSVSNKAEMNHPTQRSILHDDYDDMIYTLLLNPGKGVLQGIFWWGCTPGSLNPYPISE